jgi:hypothetical protein
LGFSDGTEEVEAEGTRARYVIKLGEVSVGGLFGKLKRKKVLWVTVMDTSAGSVVLSGKLGDVTEVDLDRLRKMGEEGEDLARQAEQLLKDAHEQKKKR